jgi:hypothetical protein
VLMLLVRWCSGVACVACVAGVFGVLAVDGAAGAAAPVLGSRVLGLINKHVNPLNLTRGCSRAGSIVREPRIERKASTEAWWPIP